ncbi:MAG: diaminopimelate dehydrogenase [Alistipes sp.]|jgi:diaminopimelate dehydrogenase|nr:diaminopimelate dehydrogenase [Alistipes sp.]
MKKIRAAVVGYGNIGKYVVEALEAAADFEVAGVVRRDASGPQPAELADYPVRSDVSELPGGVDVAVVCSPSRRVEQTAGAILARGICTVDSFDIHSEIAGLRSRLDEIARAKGAVAVVSAGWDPGSDSVVRALLEACAPLGTTHTNFGPGMSMGHSVAARAVAGVREALSMTIPTGGGVHRREVYIELAPGADFESVAAAIRTDPYFAKDDTRVTEVPSVAALIDMTHGTHIERIGVSGRTAGQKFEFSMRILNPALTAQILVSTARAAVRLRSRGHHGALTMIELAPIDLLPGEKEDIIRRLV